VTDQELDVVSRAVERAIAVSEARMKLATTEPRTKDSWGALADVMIASTKAYVQRHVDVLSKRIGQLEGRRTMAFCGPHVPAVEHAPGDVVLRSNHAWVALVPTSEAPGQSDHWRRLS
jgi:hypothetical protein